MGMVIKKLTPDLAGEYVYFFDVTPHDDRTEKAQLPCYCVTWRSDDSYSDVDGYWYETREERRERAIHFIRHGNLQGYLAYCGDKIIGWCNANADCQGGVNYLRSFYPIGEYNESVKVKSIFCLMIAPDAQRKGVATKLVERVCCDAAADGFDFVEAYPDKEYVPYSFNGPLQMYLNCGFVISNERDGKVVVRKALIT